MKLYNWQLSPNSRRVRMFILEKGLEIPPIEEVGDNDNVRLYYLSSTPQHQCECVIFFSIKGAKA